MIEGEKMVLCFAYIVLLLPSAFKHYHKILITTTNSSLQILYLHSKYTKAAKLQRNKVRRMDCQ